MIQLYLHLGQETMIKTQDIIGIFDIENTSVSKFTKEFLSSSTKHQQIQNVSYEMPKSFIICRNNAKTIVYISQISAQTLLKRAQATYIKQIKK